MTRVEDQQLIEKIQSGNLGAFRELVEANKRTIYFLALDLTGQHHDAEDLSQEVFIKAFQSIRNFRRDAKIMSWLYRITVNAFIDKKRKKSWQILQFQLDREKDKQNCPDPTDNGIFSDPERTTESLLIQKNINRALNKLSPKERTAFVLRHYQQQSIKEIVDLMNISEGSVKSLIFRAIKKLQKALSFYKADLGLEDFS